MVCHSGLRHKPIGKRLIWCVRYISGGSAHCVAAVWGINPKQICRGLPGHWGLLGSPNLHRYWSCSCHIVTTHLVEEPTRFAQFDSLLRLTSSVISFVSPPPYRWPSLALGVDALNITTSTESACHELWHSPSCLMLGCVDGKPEFWDPLVPGVMSVSYIWCNHDLQGLVDSFRQVVLWVTACGEFLFYPPFFFAEFHQ